MDYLEAERIYECVAKECHFVRRVPSGKFTHTTAIIYPGDTVPQRVICNIKRDDNHPGKFSRYTKEDDCFVANPDNTCPKKLDRKSFGC